MSAKSGSLSIVSVQLWPLYGVEMWPLYGVDVWPRSRGVLSTILNGDTVGTKVSVRHRGPLIRSGR